LVILAAIIGIVIYIRKYKRDFLNNQVIVRFRRPDAHNFTNEDSITVSESNQTNTTAVNETTFDDDTNNNNVPTTNINKNTYKIHNVGHKGFENQGFKSLDGATSDEESTAEEQGDIQEGTSRGREVDDRVKNFVGGCKQKLKINFKKDDSMRVPLDMTVPYDDTILEDQTWHTSIRDVPLGQATHSPAVLAISSRGLDNSTIQPAVPPRSILKIFGESADVENDAIQPDFQPPRRRKLIKASHLQNVLSPYLTPTCSECDDDFQAEPTEDSDPEVIMDDAFDDFYDDGDKLV